MNYEALQQWGRDNGDQTLRLNYPLNENSIVFDIGGCYGDWAQQIYNKYKCNLYVFEPIIDSYNIILNKFKDNSKLKVYNFGVSDIDKTVEMSILNEASSYYINTENKVLTKVVSFVKFLKENEIKNVDLIKINVEGDEFPILKSLIDNKMIEIFKDIQIQFHQFIPDSVNLRNSIREKLSLTHKLTYDYEFVWENWSKK
jgi:hypothetical protein